MKGTIRRKAVRPVKETRASLRSPTLDFALAGDMITRAEYQAVVDGNATLTSQDIMNVNADFHNFPTGTRQTLYPGRGTHLSNKAFLEFEDRNP